MSLNLRGVITMAGYTVLLSVPSLLGAASLSKNDAAFLKLAAKASMTEAHLGQMAEAQASRQAVKDFGQQLSKDHTTAYEGLTVLANKTGEAIPKAIGHDQTIAHLTHMKGAGFDHAFLADELQSHKAALATFKNEVAKGDSPDVKAWAESMIPTLERHLKTAEDLAKTK